MTTIKEAWAKEDLEKFEISLCHDDMFGATLALGRMARTMSKEDFKEGFQRGLENACHTMLAEEPIKDDDEDKVSQSMMSRLNSSGARVNDVCTLASKLAKRWGMVDAMKESAQTQADAMVGVLDHLHAVESNEMMGNTLWPHVLDQGQKAFITSIAMAWALENDGAGLDDSELKTFAIKFKDWIDPTDATLTKRGNDLWMNCGGFYESIYLDDGYNPHAPVSLMMNMADAIDDAVEFAPLANVANKLKSSAAAKKITKPPKAAQ